MPSKKAKKAVTKPNKEESSKELTDSDLEGVAGGVLIGTTWVLGEKPLETVVSPDLGNLGIWQPKR